MATSIVGSVRYSYVLLVLLLNAIIVNATIRVFPPINSKASVIDSSKQIVPEDVNLMKKISAKYLNNNTTTFAANALFDANGMLDTSSRAVCPLQSPLLIGRLNDDVVDITNELSMRNIEDAFPHIGPGGHWRPSVCTPRKRIAVVVPYRDRSSNLKAFLAYIIPVLQRQLLEFFFVVVEQVGEAMFNKGRLLNTAFAYIFEEMGMEIDCVVFHDVDLVPLDDRNSYACVDLPRHLSAFAQISGKVRLQSVGGVFSITGEQFAKINGYANSYWGLNAVDDDLANRLAINNLDVSVPNPIFGRFKHLKHPVFEGVPAQVIHTDYGVPLSDSEITWRRDGMTNQTAWPRKVDILPLFHHLSAEIGYPKADNVTVF